MLYRLPMKLSDRIRMARKRRKLSQPALADLLGITPQAVSQWETGKTGPERQMITAVTKILRIDEQWLFHGEEPLPALEPDEFDVFLEQLLDIAKAIPPGQRGPAVQILRALIPPTPKEPKTHQKAS